MTYHPSFFVSRVIPVRRLFFTGGDQSLIQ